MISMGRPVFSVIIPTYNSQEHIVEALNSIIDQTFRDLEILVCDGGSADGTVELVRVLNDPRISIFSEPDAGPYDAMNKGIQRSSGEWLLFLGSDDKLHDGAVLARIAGVIARCDKQLIYGNALIRGVSHWAKDGDVYDGPFTREKLRIRNICHQSIFYHSGLFVRLGVYDVRYKVCADWDFNHRCFAAGNAEYVDLIVSVFRSGGTSTLHRGDLFSREECIFRLRSYYQLTFLNRFFSPFSRVFARNAKKLWSQGYIFRAIGMSVIALVHSRRKAATIRYLFSSRN